MQFLLMLTTSLLTMKLNEIRSRENKDTGGIENTDRIVAQFGCFFVHGDQYTTYSYAHVHGSTHTYGCIHMFIQKDKATTMEAAIKFYSVSMRIIVETW